MKIICSHCHSDNAPDARLCQHCGRPVEGQVGSSEPSDAQTTLRWTEAPVRTKPGLRRWTSLDQLFAKKSKILIGRTPECDLMLAHPMVSRRHAELERTPQGLCLTDLGSTNGIAIGGKWLVGSVILRESEQVGIGPFLFSLIGQTLSTIDNSRGLRLEARHLEKIVSLLDGKPRKLLDNINLVIEPGEFVSLLGPSGSGKSTLMDCLNGRRRATGGLVLANGVNFYGYFDHFRQSLGYVPQKDIVHTQLTVARALYYTALLRLPTDTTAKELTARMEEVIKLMELDPHRDTLVSQLSGGQVKRVSLGAELLARPSLLYIDEATSGLDAGTESRMMRLFRNLADEGKSLICITHNIDNVDRCHLIIILARGKLMYYGPPAEAQTYFKVKRISEIYDRLQDHAVETWENEYVASSLYEEYVAKRLGSEQESDIKTIMPPAPTPLTQDVTVLQKVAAPQPTASKDVTPPLRPQHPPRWHQFQVLTRRYVELIWTDRRSLRLTLLQAPLIALFVLAGFIGKPFQKKIPVPAITDDEYLVLKMIQALEHDVKAANLPEDDKSKQVLSKLKFRIHPTDGPYAEANIFSFEDLPSRLKHLRDDPASKAVLQTFAVTAELHEKTGEPRRLTRTVAEILDMQKVLQHTKITQQLLEAHAVANTINPRFTYILLFLMSIIILWAGCNNAAKEIIKEEAIYGRERAVNLGVVPYLASKFLVMSVLTILQTLLLMGIVYGTLYLIYRMQPAFLDYAELPADQYMLSYIPQFFVLSLLSMAAVALGLLLSACVASPDRANALLPYVLIPQIILGGGVLPIKHSALEWLAWLMSPEYWAFRAIRLGETTLPDIMVDNRMDYDDTLWLPCTVLALETVTLLLATAWFLRKKDVS